MKEKIIIIKHAILDSIEDNEVLSALPDTLNGLDPIIFTVAPVKTTLEESGDIHWQTAADLQRQQFENEILPIINANKTSVIAYFGMSPIPLAVHMGYLIEPIKKVWVFQRHHQTKSWKWIQNSSDPFEIKTNGIPKDRFEATGDVILRVKTSFDINPELTTDLIKQHSKEIDIETSVFNTDVFKTFEQIESFANAYNTCIDAVANYLPKADTIHLFAAVPVGVAFLLGTKINPNLHPRIQTYQYSKINGGTYDAALVVQLKNAGVRPLTQEELKEVDDLRNILSKEYEQIKDFVKAITEDRKAVQGKDFWASPLFKNGNSPQPLKEGRWKHMPTIESTPIMISKVDITQKDTGERFYDEFNKTWMLDDNFLFALKTRLKTEEKIKQAFRLFIFHESSHFSLGLSSFQATGIGRFPRVLEEADFYADVWALTHEYGYTLHNSGVKSVQDAPSFFSSLIELALETFWAFDSNVDMSRPQIRRVNRYLLWYFMYSQLKLVQYSNLDDLFEALTVKPIIDLRGPATKGDPIGRTEYIFNQNANYSVSLSIYDRMNRIIRATADIHMPLGDIPKAFIQRNGIRLKEIIHAFCDMVSK